MCSCDLDLEQFDEVRVEIRKAGLESSIRVAHQLRRHRGKLFGAALRVKGKHPRNTGVSVWAPRASLASSSFSMDWWSARKSE